MNPIRMITSRADFIKGFRFELSLPLSQNFQLSHSWNIPNSTGTVNRDPMKPPNHPTYTLSAQVARDIVHNEPNTVLTARLDSNGKLDAYYIRKLAPNVTLKLISMFLNSNVEYGMLMADIDIENRNNTTGFKFSSGIFNFSHMERISRNLILGFDYSYLTSHGMSLFGYAARARFGPHNFFAQYVASQGTSSLAYQIQLRRNAVFVSSLTHEKRDNRLTTILGFKQRYSNCQILATVNSRGKIATSLTLGNPQQPYSLKLCGIVNYLKETYKFGYGITIGPSQ